MTVITIPANISINISSIVIHTNVKWLELTRTEQIEISLNFGSVYSE